MRHRLSLLAIQAAKELGHDLQIDRGASWYWDPVVSRECTGTGHAAILSPCCAS